MSSSGTAADVRDLAKALRESAPRMRKELLKRVRKAGAAALADARRRASWSTRIPGAIGLRTSTAGPKAGVMLRLNAQKAPHARPFEGLTRGGRNSFRHPVFGTGGVHADTWVSQPTRPFLAPAVNAARDQAQEDIGFAVDDVARLAGFRRR